jgi:hypothetical protein
MAGLSGINLCVILVLMSRTRLQRITGHKKMVQARPRLFILSYSVARQISLCVSDAISSVLVFSSLHANNSNLSTVDLSALT